MKNVFALVTLTLLAVNSFSQKQTFDVISYNLPQGWQQQQHDGGIQLYISDKKSGAYALAVITKASTSGSSARENFDNEWTRLITSLVKVNTGPVMLAPQKENGWEIVSGKANYTDGNNNGLATLLTATGGGFKVSVVLMTNTQQYQSELLSFINSLVLKEATPATSGNNAPSTSDKINNSSIVGLWTDYILETTGFYINNLPQYTSGYIRKEYAFYADGTYLFRNKQWLTKTKDILFIYESGTYEQHGNRLTLTPDKGKSGFWGKTTSTKEWGKPVKVNDFKLEKNTYSFDITYFKESDSYRLDLTSDKPTQRDGGQFNAPGEPYVFRYNFRKLESMIDNPPGLKTGFENKPVITAATNKPANTNKPAITTPLAGSWSYSISETGFGTMTNGYSTRQYTFNDDGTYLYRYKVFSSTMNVLLFQYESGTYNLSGNQLIISPVSGANEEWSQNKSHPDQWGALLKAGKRKLEKITYTFTLHYFSGIKETNLILQTSRTTEREGSFGSMQDYPGGWAFKPCNPQNTPLIAIPPRP